MQVGAAEICAGIAGAGFVQRLRVVAVRGVLDLEVAEAGEQVAVARIAGRHHTVEHVDAGLHRIDQILRRADAHQIARLPRRQVRRSVRQDARHVFLRFANREAADGHAVETDLVQPGQRLVTQVFVHAALNDAEQRIAVLKSVVLVTRALCPAHRQTHRLCCLVPGGRVGRAFVENHHDVRVQHMLDTH